MSELIERETVIEAVTKIVAEYRRHANEETVDGALANALDAIRSLPSAKLPPADRLAQAYLAERDCKDRGLKEYPAKLTALRDAEAVYRAELTAEKPKKSSTSSPKSPEISPPMLWVEPLVLGESTKKCKACGGTRMVPNPDWDQTTFFDAIMPCRKCHLGGAT